MEPKFNVDQFLDNREALLVHFNTPMMSSLSPGFPEDLRRTMTLTGIPISFSTIRVGDQGPTQINDPEKANAGGSVGVIVKLKGLRSLLTVEAGDSGSLGFRDVYASGGFAPSEAEVTRSVDQRIAANEWYAKDFAVIGIFVFLPPAVTVKDANGQHERPISLDNVVSAFPNQRIFSTSSISFEEWDRSECKWKSVGYDQIVRR